MSPRLISPGPHRPPKIQLAVFHPAYALGIRQLSRPQRSARAAKDFVFFAPARTSVLSAATPEDIGLAGGDPTAPPMSPLRAVVSRGHIAFLNYNSIAHSRLDPSWLEATVHCTARCAPSITLLSTLWSNYKPTYCPYSGGGAVTSCSVNTRNPSGRTGLQPYS